MMPEEPVTVGKLKEWLEDVDDDLVVVLSSDGEGNSYDTLWASGVMVYVEEDREVYFAELTSELFNAGYGEEDIYQGNSGVKALVLWP